MSDATALLQETADRLAAGSRETAARWLDVAPGASQAYGNERLAIISHYCLEIAATGWKATDSVDAYLGIVAAGADWDELQRISDSGLALTGYSYEPSAAYFTCARHLAEQERLATLPEIERTGKAIRDQFSHASSLQTLYYRAAADSAPLLSATEYAAWLELLRVSVSVSRDHLSRFIEADVAVPFAYLLDLYRLAPAAAMAYLDILPILNRTLDQADKTVIENLCRRLVDQDPAAFMLHLADLLDADAQLTMTALTAGEQIDNVIVLDRFMAQSQALPLDRPAVIAAWLRRGLEAAGDNVPAAVAWVAAESLTSIETLRHLEGQVRYADHRRLFELLAEAVCGDKMVVTAEDEPADLRRPGTLDNLMASSDGRCIYLPAEVDLFDHETGNFGFYKVSLFHQLAYREFGCFALLDVIKVELETYPDQRRAERLFLLLEDMRIDWRLAEKYPGLVPQIAQQKYEACRLRGGGQVTFAGRMLEALMLFGLDVPLQDIKSDLPEDLQERFTQLTISLAALRADGETAEHSLQALRRCYSLIFGDETDPVEGQSQTVALLAEEFPEPVSYRGELDVEEAVSALKVESLVEELAEEWQTEGDDTSLGAGLIDPEFLDIDDLESGEVGEGVGVIIEELSKKLDVDLETLAGSSREEVLELFGGMAMASRDAVRFHYDEWDYLIRDYRSAWCTLLEHRDIEPDEDYVSRTMVEHDSLARRIRQELNKVRPEMLRKVRGVHEGEELDLERSVAYFVDRKTGFSPDENIYVQRQRRERDVSTLFLLDMSASTDDIIPDPEAEPVLDSDNEDDDYIMDYFRQRKAYEDQARRIIDLEKESVILMCEGLEQLGDAYSVCGFSGYGRDQVDYYLCKDFDEPLDARSRGRIGGIKPCRSTRMGPPIRHGTRRLLETGSRIKAMIIISDGYPQDHDYGADRNSRDYGLMDTMKALSEAKQQGVLTYCLTVDPSGHDYLREMCPDSQYMVIQDLDQLPEELSRVYRSLTG